MNILYCGDSNIEEGLMLSVLSLLKHIEEPLNIYVLTMSLETDEKVYSVLPDKTIAFVNDLLHKDNPNSSIIKIDVTKAFQKEMTEVNLKTRFTPYCMLRLFADDVLEIPNRILYLDTDVLCRMDITEFYHQDITAYEFAAVLDYYGSWFFRKKFYRRDYCNSGVMLLNMKKIRETVLFKKCRKLCFTKKMFMPDQSALNKLAVAKKIMPRRFNEQRRLHHDTVLQHFTTNFRFFPYIRTVTVKPWMFEEVHKVLKLHEYDELFKEYQTLINNKPSIKSER